jgi:hypothetical protein
VLLDELCALVPDPCFLGQLPVFMAHLGTAVKQQRTHYPLYALFRRLNLPKVMYNFVRQDVHFHSIDELRLFLVSSIQAHQDAAEVVHLLEHEWDACQCMSWAALHVGGRGQGPRQLMVAMNVDLNCCKMFTLSVQSASDWMS